MLRFLARMAHHAIELVRATVPVLEDPLYTLSYRFLHFSTFQDHEMYCLVCGSPEVYAFHRHAHNMITGDDDVSITQVCFRCGGRADLDMEEPIIDVRPKQWPSTLDRVLAMVALPADRQERDPVEIMDKVVDEIDEVAAMRRRKRMN